jgi:N-hydroxyarylamine O-acetyltransferase
MAPGPAGVREWIVTWVEEYLSRIGCDVPDRPDDDHLRELHARHLLTVPFENLSIHLGEAIVLDSEALVDKVIRRRRGGFCYELNGAFASLLTALGYRVELLAARTHGPTGLGIPYDHMVLRVGPWLVDVGFGRHTLYPLRWDLRGDQADPGGVFRVEETADGDLDVARNGEPQFRAWSRPQALGDFVAGCWWHSTSPQSHFTRSAICSLTTVDGRISLSGDRLIRTSGEHREETELATDAEILAAYRDLFGIALDVVPQVRQPRP